MGVKVRQTLSAPTGEEAAKLVQVLLIVGEFSLRRGLKNAFITSKDAIGVDGQQRHKSGRKNSYLVLELLVQYKQQ